MGGLSKDGAHPVLGDGRCRAPSESEMHTNTLKANGCLSIDISLAVDREQLRHLHVDLKRLD